MAGLDEILRTQQAEALISNKDAQEHLMGSPESQQILKLLNQNAGGKLEQVAERAAKGDSTQLMDAIKQFMQNPEAAQLVSQLKQKLK